jgi:hypothetical protein
MRRVQRMIRRVRQLIRRVGQMISRTGPESRTVEHTTVDQKRRTDD